MPSTGWTSSRTWKKLTCSTVTLRCSGKYFNHNLCLSCVNIETVRLHAVNYRGIKLHYLWGAKHRPGPLIPHPKEPGRWGEPCSCHYWAASGVKPTELDLIGIGPVLDPYRSRCC